ncbi:hypothetical protein AAZV13_16G064900 [Glycine max]
MYTSFSQGTFPLSFFFLFFFFSQCTLPFSFSSPTSVVTFLLLHPSTFFFLFLPPSPNPSPPWPRGPPPLRGDNLSLPFFSYAISFFFLRRDLLPCRPTAFFFFLPLRHGCDLLPPSPPLRMRPPFASPSTTVSSPYADICIFFMVYCCYWFLLHHHSISSTDLSHVLLLLLGKENKKIIFLTVCIS